MHTKAREMATNRVGLAALVLWAVGAFAITGSLASAHSVSLPRPARQKPALARAFAERVLPEEHGRVTVTHVLYGECRCSQRIVDHLVQRGARRDVSESSLLAGPSGDLAQRLRHAGFRVDEVAPEALATRYAIEAAPLLVVADKAHQIRYLGGYSERKQGTALRDDALIDAVLAGADARELPLLGCAVSQRLQALLDPFGLLYPARKDVAR